MKDKLSWIKINNKVSVYINSDIYHIEDENTKYEEILKALNDKNVDLVKALIDPLKYGIVKTQIGLGVIIEHQISPFWMKVLVHNEIRLYKSLWDI